MSRYAVWMEIPSQDAKSPFSRIAGDLTAEEAEVYRRTLLFRARVMPESDGASESE